MADEMMSLIVIGLCIFSFLAVLLGIGEFYGGQWQIVAQGITKVILIIVGFAFACYVLVNVMGRR